MTRGRPSCPGGGLGLDRGAVDEFISGYQSQEAELIMEGGEMGRSKRTQNERRCTGSYYLLDCRKRSLIFLAVGSNPWHILDQSSSMLASSG